MCATPRPCSDAERLDALRLARTENVGPITFRRLIGRLGSAKAALEALPELARRGGRRRPLKVCSVDAASRELSRLAELGGRLLVLGEPEYPQALAAIADAPPVLSVLGDATLLDRRSVAVVGARNASANGRRLAAEIARELGGSGLVVVSGLARGIDAAAHRAALPNGTVAALAGGIDMVYPPENEDLHREIAERGALISELPPEVEPQARHFPRRNRLVSGLALGVVVVEAALRSGSLITARLALEQGREVFAVPGSPLDPRCRGANNLIREGATLTESATDVLQVLDGMVRVAVAPEPFALAETPDSPAGDDLLAAARAQVQELLGPAPAHVDDIVRETGVPAGLLRMVLLELELAGRLERQAGDRIALLPERLELGVD